MKVKLFTRTDKTDELDDMINNYAKVHSLTIKQITLAHVPMSSTILSLVSFEEAVQE